MEPFLSIASFALGLGAFLAAIWPPPPSNRRRWYFLVMLLCAIVFVGIEVRAFWEYRERSMREELLSRMMISRVGNEQKTAEDIREEVPEPDRLMVGPILLKLTQAGVLECKSVPVKDGAGLEHKA